MNQYIGIGTLIVFKKIGHSELIHNSQFPTDFYMNLYDPFASLIFNDIFLGQDLNLSIAVIDPDSPYYLPHSDSSRELAFGETPLLSNHCNDLNISNLYLELKQPIENLPFEIKTTDIGLMDLTTYAIGNTTFRIHMMMTMKDYITYEYNDIDYFHGTVLQSVKNETFKINNASFVSTFVYKCDEEIDKSYLYALSVFKEDDPEYHLFNISDVMSWVSKIKLTNITDDDYKVVASQESVNFIEEQNTIIVHAYQKNRWTGSIKDSFYFYHVVGKDIYCFDVVRSDEVEHLLYKFVYISEYLYYLIYKDAHYVDVYKLNANLRQHSIEYRLGISSNETYLTGHT